MIPKEVLRKLEAYSWNIESAGLIVEGVRKGEIIYFKCPCCGHIGGVNWGYFASDSTLKHECRCSFPNRAPQFRLIIYRGATLLDQN